ncbi:hypothetical protein E6H23_04375 [Candidatus Bathyarchaeota archaeon]|nr:MAG: hypothetical protein E6H23_04375 [Candidatus Bathyarchaeota archaeon]
MNHGLLLYGRPERPVPVPYGYNPAIPLHQSPEYFLPGERQVLALPNRALETRAPIPARAHSNLTPKHGKYRLAKTIGRSLKHALAGYSQAELNESIMKGLRYQFSQERVDAVIDQAFSIYYSHDPDRNRPELYELYENGDIDRALEQFSVRWVLGRPKTYRKYTG